MIINSASKRTEVCFSKVQKGLRDWVRIIQLFKEKTLPLGRNQTSPLPSMMP